MEELIDTIGEKIKELRLEKKLTINDISQRTSLTKSLISQIENGKSLPSLKSLLAITKALETTVGYLFSADTDTGDIVVKASNRKMISTKNGVTLFLLTPDLRNRKVEFLSVIYEKGSSSGLLHTHSGEEYGIVLKGKLNVAIKDESYILEEGDSIVINSEIPHQITNVHSGKTEVIWANTPPTL
jgi:transcriptional regulator with XRE-family HTH domain